MTEQDSISKNKQKKNQIDKVNVVHIHNGVLFSHKKEWDCVIYNNMNGTGGHYLSKPGRERKSFPCSHLFVGTKNYNN